MFSRVATLTLIFIIVSFSVSCTSSGSSTQNSASETISNADSRDSPKPELKRLFPTEKKSGPTYANCLFTSPHLYTEGEDKWVITATAAGTIQAVVPETGKVDWSVELSAPDEGAKFLLSTPALVEDKLIVAYQAITPNFGQFRDPNDERLAHLVAVVDLENRQVAPDFPVVELQADVEANEPEETVEFRPSQALTRPRVVHANKGTDSLGRIYLGQGNTRDIQPWHGWAWEIDLDTWKTDGTEAAVSGVLNTTPEPDSHCGEPGTSGSRERLCGGGLWAPSGHAIVPDSDGAYDIVLAPGIGQLDLTKRDYANTLMRVEPGLDFSPKCNADACSNFNPDKPSADCIESCKNLFVPRLESDQSVPNVGDGTCEGKTLFECWSNLDYIGGSTPAYIELDDRNVLVYPTKDGHAYVVDADNLGTMYQRYRLVDTCGTDGATCQLDWAGMSVTKPEPFSTDEQASLMITTFMPDQKHSAGIVSVKAKETSDGVELKRLWEFPDFDSTESVQHFRRHPSRIRVMDPSGDTAPIAWIVEPKDDRGNLFGIDPATGQKLYERKLKGPGRRYVQPLAVDNKLFVPSCHSNDGPGRLEGYKLVGAE